MTNKVNKAVDSIQQRLTEYASRLEYTDLTAEAVHAAKVRVIDTLGALVAGFFAPPCRIARDLAAQMPNPDGATVIGTRMKTSPDMAAFANGTTHRYIELTDTYHWPGSFGGHPSDVVTPVLTAAEYARASGRGFITAVVLAYEIYLRIDDIFDNMGFDHTNFCCLGTAVSTGKMLGLTPEQLSHCIAMAVVPNVALRIARMGHLSMWKVAATGQAGRAGVFAALLAQAGMEGPHLPFEGKAGWCDHVALKRFALDTMGGNGTSFKIQDTSIKLRPTVGLGIPSILAAEKIAPLRNIRDVKEITIEMYKRAYNAIGSGAHLWNPDTKETADHSAPYLVAVALMDGTVSTRSFDSAHLSNPEIRALMQKIKIVENPEFTAGYARVPAEQRARVTVVTASGERLVGETGNDKLSLGAPQSDAQIEEKFRSLTEDVLGAKRVRHILDRLWHLEKMENVAAIPSDFVMI